MPNLNELIKLATELYNYRAQRNQVETLRLSAALIDFNELTAEIHGVVAIRSAFDALRLWAAETGDRSLMCYVSKVGAMV